MRKLLLVYIVFLGIVFAAGSLHAQDADENPVTNPTSFLVASPDDAAVEVVDRLFEKGWQNLFFQGESTDSSNALFEMLKIFNMVVLAGAAIMFMYIIGTGILGTAHEGQAMGKKQNTLWTPIRSSFAISLLMPLPWAKGLSLLQALILACAYWGIGGASLIWNTGVEYLADNAGQVTSMANYDDSTNLARGALMTQIARVYKAEEMDGPAPSVVTKWFPNDPASGKYIKDGGKHRIFFEFDGVGGGLKGSHFGKFEIPCEEKTNPLCQARKDGVLKLLKDVEDPAKKMKDIVVSGGEDISGDLIGVISSDDFVKTVHDYENIVKVAALEQIENKSEDYSNELEQFEAQAKAKGFAFAGAWYWTIARYNRNAAEAITAYPTYEEVSLNKIGDIGSGGLNDIKNMAAVFVNNGQKKLQDTAQQRDIVNKGGVGGVLDNISSWFTRPFSSVNPISALGLDEDPILAMQGVGNTLINGSLVAMTTMFGADIAAHTTSETAKEGTLSWIPFVGDASIGASAAVKRTLEHALTVGGAVLIMTFVFGCILAYYLPAVPFILFTSAFVGWLILLIESIVAAPLWAASHIDASDEGITGQRGKTGYMLFAGILMRPWLMVMGFFASYLMFSAIGQFLNTTLSTFSAGLRMGTPSGLITFLAFTVLAGSLTILYAHKMFGLITWLPDNVMKWVGQQVQNLGESQDVSQSQSHFHGAAGFIYRGGADGANKVKRGAQQAAKGAGGGSKGSGGSAGGGGDQGGGGGPSSTDRKDVQQGGFQGS